MSLDPPADQDIVIIGATGDLAKRKLLPALYNLHLGGLLPRNGHIIGYARRPLSDAEFRDSAAASIREFSRTELDEGSWPAFAERLRYVDSGQGLAEVARCCSHLERLIYLSIPPSAFPTTIAEVASGGLVEGARIVVEKPFGHDLESAYDLDGTIHKHFEEQQVFRIDHYLGKETVQNILVFRLGNSVFERVWNRDAIDHVQITVAESIGIEGRGAFYEEAGALRDILQNHVLQVLAMLTMEPPASFHPEAVRDEAAKLFHAIRPIDPADAVRGQYIRAQDGGEILPGYREETGVAASSEVETFAAIRLFIDNWRWSGVPIFLRTGKRMPRKATEVAISFREAPVRMFEGTGVGYLRPNLLTLSIQPDEEISFRFLAKEPGPEISVKPATMHFSFDETFSAEPAEAYERLLHDAMGGDHTLFARADAVHRSWQIIERILDEPPAVNFYPAATWGPPESDTLIAPRAWLLT